MRGKAGLGSKGGRRTVCLSPLQGPLWTVCTACWRPSRVCGDLRLSGGVGRSPKAGSGMARSRAKARLNFAQGQRSGDAGCNRRAERVSRPAREKNRRRRVLVVARGPAGQVVGHRLDGQPGAVGEAAARGDGSYLRSVWHSRSRRGGDSLQFPP